MEPRFQATVVSVGASGLAQRPAVVDTHTGHLATVDGEQAKVWRAGEEHLAQAAADRLNEQETAMHATDIVGYVFQAEIVCPEHMKQEALRWEDTTPAAAEMDIEPLLDQVAEYRLIDRSDESSFDSDEFPKVVFASDASGEFCGVDGEDLT